MFECAWVSSLVHPNVSNACLSRSPFLLWGKPGNEATKKMVPNFTRWICNSFLSGYKNDMQATLELIYRISLIRRRGYCLFHSLFLCSYYLRAVAITSVESPLVSMTAGSGIHVQAGQFNEAWGYGAILPLGRLSTSRQLATMR